MTATDSDFIKALGGKIARLRKMQGLNQFEFADNCGKMVNTISKIERGIGDPRLTTLLDISRALNVSLTDLLDPRFALPSTKQLQNAFDFNSAIINLLDKCDNDTKKVILELLQRLAK